MRISNPGGRDCRRATVCGSASSSLNAGMTIRWRIAASVGGVGDYSKDAPRVCFIPGGTEQPAKKAGFTSRATEPQAADVLKDTEKQVELDDAFARGHADDAQPSPISRLGGDHVVKLRFLFEAKQALGVSRGRVFRVPAIRVGDSWQPDHRPAAEQNAGEEVEVEDHPPVRTEVLRRQPTFAIADRRAHDEVAVHERFDGRLPLQYKRSFPLRLQISLDVIDEREALLTGSIDHFRPAEERGSMGVFAGGAEHHLDVDWEKLVIIVEQVDEVGFGDLQAPVPIPGHAEVALVSLVPDSRIGK